MILANLLTVASILIAKNWKTNLAPTICAWKSKVRFVCLISNLTANIDLGILKLEIIFLSNNGAQL